MKISCVDGLMVLLAKQPAVKLFSLVAPRFMLKFLTEMQKKLQFIKQNQPECQYKSSCRIFAFNMLEIGHRV